MGQQHRKVTKRRRRINYIKRKKELEQASKTLPVRLAVSIAKDDDSEKKPAAPKKKAAAPKTKKAPAKKAPAADSE